MKYQRVTQILYPFGGLKYVDSTILENAAVRGTKVHNICEGIATGLGVWDIPEEYKGYVDSFNNWFDQGRKIKAVEERFFCDDMCITGKVDFIIEGPNGLVIVDLKTGQSESKSWLLQGSAYSYLAKKKGYDIKEIMFLRLKRNGRPPREYYYDENMTLFKECLNVYRYFYGKRAERYN